MSGIRRTTEAELQWLFQALGVNRGDTVLVHSAVMTLGLVEGGVGGILSAILRAVGPEGTVVVPTFTWSFRRGEVFDIRHSPARKVIGTFAEYVRQDPSAVRSADPLFSMAAIGPEGPRLMERRSFRCFGGESTYEAIFSANVLILALGITYSTGISPFMHLECLAGVPYRQDLRLDGKSIGPTGAAFDDYAIHFARDELGYAGWHTDREAMGRTLEEKGVAKAIRFGSGRHIAMRAEPFGNVVLDELAKNPLTMLRRDEE
jgi:aminoglycoside 3-N-acetyltransferase